MEETIIQFRGVAKMFDFSFFSLSFDARDATFQEKVSLSLLILIFGFSRANSLC